MRYERDLIASHGVPRYSMAKGSRREAKEERARIDRTLWSNGTYNMDNSCSRRWPSFSNTKSGTKVNWHFL